MSKAKKPDKNTETMSQADMLTRIKLARTSLERAASLVLTRRTVDANEMIEPLLESASITLALIINVRCTFTKRPVAEEVDSLMEAIKSGVLAQDAAAHAKGSAH